VCGGQCAMPSSTVALLLLLLRVCCQLPTLASGV
jgi:hypothetical protein